MCSVTIVIPCYNEENRLPVEEYKRFLSTHTADLLFVNDGSTDRTITVLEALQTAYPLHIRILDLPTNMGKAEAVRRGVLEIDYYEKDDIIGFIDADLSTPFEEISYFIDAFHDSRIQFVFGSRIARIGADIQRFHYRHYFGRLVATLVSTYLKIPVYDSQCGAKFFHADFAKRLFGNPFVSKWLFDVEIFRRIALLQINVQHCALELPLHTWIEKGGSKIRFSDYLKLPFEFYKIMHHYTGKKAYVPEPILIDNAINKLIPKEQALAEKVETPDAYSETYF